MNKQIKSILDRYEEKGDFTHEELTDEMLSAAEARLGVKIPAEFVAFMREYGFGGIGGIEILGVSGSGECAFVKATLEYRKYGLPANLIVAENCDEWLYCIDCDDGKVVNWSEGEEASPAYDSFDAYFLDRLNDEIENM